MTREEAIEFIKNIIGEEAGRCIGKEGFYAELIGYHIEALEMAIQALSQEPITTTNNNEPMTIIYPTIVCDDAISRDAVIQLFNGNIGSEAALILHKVKQLPSVTQKSGKWIGVTPMVDTLMCSECGENIISADFKSNYCPNCGAIMVEPQESEE